MQARRVASRHISSLSSVINMTGATMNPYAIVLCLHVCVAVLGLGQTAALALLLASRTPILPSDALPSVLRLFARTISVSLAIVLGTGVLLDLLAAGAWHHAWWFRGSVLMLLLLGFLAGSLRRALRAPEADVSRRVRGIAWAMCGLVVVISCLMAAKPW